MFLNCSVGEVSVSPLDCKEIQPVHPKGDQSWVFIGRTHAEAEALMLWPHDVKNWLLRKNPDAGKDWRQKEKRATEDKMVGLVSLVQWTWIRTNSERLWGTGKPGVLQSMGLWRVGHNLATEQQQFNKTDAMRYRKSKQIYSHLWKWINGSKSNSLKNPPV